MSDASSIGATHSETVLERLNRLHPKLIDLSLGRIERLLDRLGRPQDALPNVIHVAGTNGKGSVVAMLRAVCEAGGLRCHVYTSPHLVTFHERIRLAGKLIREEVLYETLLECERANDGAPITYFEIATAAALLAFSRVPADVTLLEVGLGGRLDATNVVARPAATVITPVAMDHMSYLGETLEAIAGEKAGILKPDVPAVIGRQQPAAAAVIDARAAAVGALPLRHGREWTVHAEDEGLRFEFRGQAAEWPRPNLFGAHQVENAGMVLACLAALDLRPADTAIRHGLTSAEWPARMQKLTRGPLATLLPPGWELWLDGGHNPDAAAAVAAVMDGWDDRPVHLVVGMMGSKDPAGFAAPLLQRATSATAVGIPGYEHAMPAAELAAALGIPAADSVADAITASIGRTPEPARVLICGSLYLSGTVLRENG
ncbi:MAG: folylpolyglutamate synthase/dihydrofolate synthase family protein [Acetobacterales bacterium]